MVSYAWSSVMHLLVALATLCVSSVMAAEDCYTASGIAGIVVATIIVTLIVVGLVLGLLWYLRKKRSAPRLGDVKDDMPLGDPSGSDCKYAFDNPYFKEEDSEKTNLDAAEKGQANVPVKNSTAPSSPQSTKSQPAVTQQSTQQNATAGTKNKKRKVSISHPFAVFHPSVKKQQRAMDDSYLAMEPERMVVPLRGHDFTGLGFNVCGNMRDGIFVKDVLHRGPASESGKVKAGDRIVSVTVSFTNMVYEDALTILSYASPYDVQLEIEKATEKSHAVTAMGPSGKRLGSSSFSAGGQRLFHPLYRSQSIDDLTQIGKDSFSHQGSSPKRSQSIGLTSQPLVAGKCNLSPRNLEGNAEEMSSAERSLKPISLATGSLNERVLASAMGEDAKKLKLEVQKEAAIVEGSMDTTESSDSSSKKVKDLTDKIKLTEFHQNEIKTDDNDNKERKLSLQEVRNSSDTEQKKEEKSQSLPRKTATPGKRKAPPPPTTATGYVGVPLKTTAQIHQSENEQSKEETVQNGEDEVDNKLGDEEMESQISSDLDKDSIGCPPGSELLESAEIDSLDQSSLLNNPGSRLLEDTNTDSGGSNDSLEPRENPHKMTTNNGQRKSSSLVDLTKMDGTAQKSSTQLERAVSMDFKQQPLPEGNLGQQKKMLHPPLFGSETISEDYESSLNPDEEIGVTKVPKTNLTKWNSHGVWDQANQNIANIAATQNGNDSLESGVITTGTTTSIELTSRENPKSIADVSSGFQLEIHSGSDDRMGSSEEAPSDISVSLPNISNSTDDGDSVKTLTSTPVRRIIKTEDFLKSDLTNGKNSHNGVVSDGDLKKDHDELHTSGNAKNESTIISSPYLHNTISIDIPVIPPIVDRHSPLSNPPRSSVSNKDPSNSNSSKEVIEISEHELDDVMMSHRQFLLKQAKMTGVYSNLNPDVNRQASEIDFESWSYDDGNYPTEDLGDGTQHPASDSVNGNGSEASSYYRTALEINDLSSSKDTSSITAKKPVMPEISGYTVRTSEGGITKTIIISNPEGNSSTPATGNRVSLADSPPPNLEPPPH